MTKQLLLLDDSDHDWKLDPRTRELGRLGVARARQVLREAPRRHEATADAIVETLPDTAQRSESSRPARRRPVAA